MKYGANPDNNMDSGWAVLEIDLRTLSRITDELQGRGMIREVEE